MACDDAEKLAIVLECMEIDNPRSPKDYIDNMSKWSLADLHEYLNKRRKETAGMKSHFRPHP